MIVPSVGRCGSRELYERLVQHITSESEVLERYEGLAEESSGHVRFLLDLIAEDEARHHRLYDRWAPDGEGDGPGRGAERRCARSDPRARARAACTRAIEAAFARSREGRRPPAQGAGEELKDVRHTTIWPLLVELMEMDTRKHIKILEGRCPRARPAHCPRALSGGGRRWARTCPPPADGRHDRAGTRSRRRRGASSTDLRPAPFLTRLQPLGYDEG